MASEIDLSEVIEKLEKEESEKAILVGHLKEIERSEIAKKALEDVFNMHSLNENHFLTLPEDKLEKVDELLAELLSAVYNDSASAIKDASEQIGEVLDN